MYTGIKLVSMKEKKNHTLVIIRTSNFLILDSHIISPNQALILRKWTRKRLCEFIHSTFSTSNCCFVGLNKDFVCKTEAV